MRLIRAIRHNYPHAVPRCGYPSVVLPIVNSSTICPHSVDILWISPRSGPHPARPLGTTRHSTVHRPRLRRRHQHPSTGTPYLSTGSGARDTPAHQPQDWLCTLSTGPMTMTTPLDRSDDEPHPHTDRWTTALMPRCTKRQVCCKTDASSHDTSWQGRTR